MKMLAGCLLCLPAMAGCTHNQHADLAPVGPPPPAESRRPERDLLDVAQRPPRFRQRRSVNNGPWETSKYGDFNVDEAAEALKDIPRPWTLKKMLRLYQEEKKAERRVRLIYLMAVSHDPRVAVILGEGLTDSSVAVRIAAAVAMSEYYSHTPGVGGLEATFKFNQQWWRENEQLMRIRARALSAEE